MLENAGSKLQQWLYSGCGIQVILILYGFFRGHIPKTLVPLLTALAFLHIAYAIASTSWLLYDCFVYTCYCFVPLTCLLVFPSAASFGRRISRGLLRKLSFTSHGVAYFHPPALHIDTEVDGIFVVRGLTVNLAQLRVEAHGIEVAVQIFPNVQLAIYADEVCVNLSRGIDISAVYATLKDESSETIFEAKSNSTKDEVSNSGSSGSASKIPWNDADAETQYDDIRQDIFDSSPINRSQEQMGSTKNSKTSELGEAETRATICGKLVGSPAVPHTPKQTIKVTTLQNLLPRWLHRFLARLPFLLRLLLMPLSFLHPITVPSITVAGPGHWLASMLRDNALDEYIEDTDESQDLKNRLSEWLEQAMFSADFTNITALGQVPIRTIFDIVAELRCANTMVFRTATDTIESAIQLSGADVRFVIPSYLLPYHEHLVPARPENQHQGKEPEKDAGTNDQTDEHQQNNGSEQSESDQAEISMRIHATLPASTDHTLLEFIVDLVNDSSALQIESGDSGESQSLPDAMSEKNSSANDEDAQQGKPKLAERAKGLVRNHVKERAKQFAMRGLNQQQSRWMKSAVRQTASQLERVHGDVGYSGSIPVSLETYRASQDLPSKLWL